ncbi:MAG: hypothetical protein AB1468_04080 [Candidatus Micrarchaeota archaeon]
MNKTHFVFVALVLFVGAVLFGCGGQAPEAEVKFVCADGSVVSNKTLCPGAPPGTGAPTGAPSAPTTPAAGVMTTEMELSVCADMPEVQGMSLEAYCITGLAGKHKNTSLCKKLGMDERKNCYALVAEVSNDVNLCAEAGTGKDQCYQQYANDMRDASACDKISDVNYKDSCYNGLASNLGDPALCDKIRNVNQKDSCYWSMASRLGDSSYCNSITNSDQKQNCLQNIQGMGGGGVPKPPG